MKKKILLCVLFLILTFSCTKVYADDSPQPEAGSNAGTETSDNAPTCTNALCYTDRDMYGVRATIVDSKGVKLPGTNIVDFVSNPSLVTNKTDFELTNLNLNVVGYISSEKKIRNQVLTGGTTPVQVNLTSVQAYYWGDFPKFVGNNVDTYVVRRYVLSLYRAKPDSFKKLFDLLGYNPYEITTTEDGLTTYTVVGRDDIYLLLEPISYISLAYKDAYYVRVYGTVSEVMSMITNGNLDFGVDISPYTLTYGNSNGTIKFWLATYRSSLHVMNRYQGGNQYNYTAGLWSKDSGDSSCSDIKDILKTSTVPVDGGGTVTGGCGFASSHFWVYDLITDTGDECIGECCYKECKEEPEQCSKPTTYAPNSCEISSHGYVADSTNWKCIYDQMNKYDGSYESKYYNFDNSPFKYDSDAKSFQNPYCTVACRETINYYLPDSTGVEINSGLHILINDRPYTYNGYNILSPVTFEGISVCQTGYKEGISFEKNENTLDNVGIKVSKFVDDYKGADDAVVAAWEELQKTKAAAAAKAAVEARLEDYADDAAVDTGEVYTHQVTSVTATCVNAQHQFGGKKCQPDSGKGTIDAVGYVNESQPSSCALTSCPATLNEYVDSSTFTWVDDGGHGGWCYYDTQKVTACTQNYEHNGNATVPKKKITETVQGYTAVGYFADGGTNCKHKDVACPRTDGNGCDVAKAQEDYDKAVSNRQHILDLLLQCNNFQRQFTEFTPEVSFAYNDSYYNYATKLQLCVSTDAGANYAKTDYYYFTDKFDNKIQTATKEWQLTKGNDSFVSSLDTYGKTTTIDSHNCTGDYTDCSTETYNKPVTYPINTFVSQETKRTYKYKLNDSTYRYIYKKDGVSYNSVDEMIQKYSVENVNSGTYAYLPYSILPISKSTPRGSYLYYFDYSEKLFGTQQKFYNVVDKGIMSNKDGLSVSDKLGYTCSFEIKENDFCTTCCPGDPGYPNCPPITDCPCGKKSDGSCKPCGPTVIYRPISLEDPFPAITGKGRSPGANWLGSYNNEMSVVEKYIKNNRNVRTEQVYDLEPMYEFYLEPINLRRIRAYNVTKNGDYNDFEFNCTNNKYCKSEFLRTGIEQGFFQFTGKNQTGGVCFNATVTDWESCRYETIDIN